MKNKKILKLLIVFLIILSLCTVLLRNTWVFAEDEEDVDENYVQEEPTNEESTSDEDENNAIASLDAEQESKINEELQQMLTGIPWSYPSNPITNVTFNSNPNYFCYQHGTPYATSSNIDGFQGNYNYMNASGLAYVYNNLTLKKPGIGTKISIDYKQKGTNPGTRVSYSNFHYRKVSQSYSGGFAFVLAKYKQTAAQRASTGYTNDPLQHAVWAHARQLRSGESNPLAPAMQAFDDYYSAAMNNPNINVTPAQNVGTVKSGNNYVVGPFKMSNYVRAVDYKYYEPTGYTGGQTSGSEDEKNSNSNPKWNTGNTNLQAKFGTAANMQGTIIKAVAVLNNGNEIEFPVPDPGATFNISIPISKVGSADELKSIKFTYQRIYATGNGTWYEGKQIELTWSQTNEDKGCSTYYCQNQTPGYANHHTSSVGGTHSCTYTWTCYDHYSGHGCGGHTRYCSGCRTRSWTDSEGKKHSESYCPGHRYTISGCHCSCTGHSATHTSTFKCSHGYTNCRSFSWKVTSINEDHCQDGLEAYGSLGSTIKIYKINVNVPLTTNVSIYKYIVKVNHQNNDYIYGRQDADDTSRKTKTDKNTNTVKVERGDRITYRIDIVNSSRFDIRLKVKDYFPSNVEQVTVPGSFYTENQPGGNQNGAWIQVNARKTKTFYVTVVANALESSYTNTVQIITRNDTNPHMEYVKYGGHGPGPIVNLSNRLSDSDTYTIKEYQVNINKHITSVEHTTNSEKTYDSTAPNESNLKTNQTAGTRVNRTDEQNQSDPVYVEYGDRVYYEIDVYNTNNKDYRQTNNSAKPYWKPDMIHVNVEDTLPAKYSDLKITIENAMNSPSITKPGTSSTSGGTIKISDLQIAANTHATIKISLVVEEVKADTVCGNTAKIVGKINNINNRYIKNNEIESRLTSTDYYKLNDYYINIDKYVSSYDGLIMNQNNQNQLTNETSTINTDESVERRGKSDAEKENSPFKVEKTETVTYSIRLDNKSTNNATKPATKVRTTDITETLQQGLEFQNDVTAKIFKSDGSVRVDNIKVNITDKGNNVYNLNIGNKQGEEYTTLNPGEYIIYYVKVKITESNMYLYNLENKAEITTLTNINNTEKDPQRVVTEQNKYPIKKSSEYVKQKDLVIAGKVWLDKNQDGYMTEDETKFKDIVVHLYDAKTDKIVNTVRTNENGLYTFGRVYKASTKYDGSSVIGTIDEEGNKKNYKQGTDLNSYYVEFEYDGLMYKSTEIYSNDKHISESWLQPTDSGNYINDSNAYEFKDVREQFNTNYETIGYNVGYKVGEDKNSNSGTTTLEYSKDNHNSTLLEDRNRLMTARSFIISKDKNKSDGTANNTKSLWLYPLNSSNYKLAETEYLKYINLGLEEREDIDISLKKDVYQVKTTINGEEVIYDYNQENTNSEYTNDYVIKKAYGIDFYESDYKYRYEQYKNEKVQNYKGKESELNVEVTFKIAITNENIRENEPYRENKDVPVDVTIDELADYYDTNFMKYTGEENNTIKVKTKDGDYLKDKDIKIAEAWYKSSEDSTESRQLILSNTSNYNKERNFTADGYNTLYIRGFDDIKIKEGETGYVFVKYVLDKEEGTRNLKITDSKANNLGIEGIAEINAYSTWYGAVSEEYKKENPAYEENYPAGLVDKDSNPGNIGDDNGVSTSATGNKSADDTGLYEDDTYKTGIQMNVKTITNPPENGDPPSIEQYRVLSGFVWDDSRSESINDSEDNVQYAGNGLYNTSDTKLEEAKSNENVLELLDKSSDYKNIVNRFNNPTAEQNDFVVKDAKAQLIEIVKIPENEVDPSSGGTKYYEEIVDANWARVQETRTNSNGKYVLSGFIPGYYTVRFTYGDTTSDEMMTFNGQDYKTTKYTTGVENYTYKPEAGETELNTEKIKEYDKIMEALEAENKSDARDDEIDRLNAISYSEIMTNEKADTLKGISIPEGTDKEARKETLAEKTKMNAETVTFYVKPEKLDSYESNVTYATCTNIPYDKIKTRTYNVKNIDMGIEYRPEAEISLNKEIKTIELVTSNSEKIMKVAFKDVIDSDGKKKLNDATGRVEREVDFDNSVGLENIQFICNNNRLQGFAYINVDDEILQGSKISVEYEFTVTNISEVDRISKNLDVLRYKENSENAISSNSTDRAKYVEENNYLGSETAEKYLHDIVYEKDNRYASDDEYRIIEKTMTTGDDNYYGRYLGSTYFTSNVTEKDTVVDLKIDKVLDYIDTDLSFKSSSNQDTDHFWETTTSEALRTGDGINGSLVDRNLFVNVNKDTTNNTEDLKLVNLKGVAFDSDLMSNLAISMDDRNNDDQTDNVINKQLSKFLEPKTVKTTAEEYSGYVALTTEKLISSETDTDNLRFENIAEIIQYTCTSGRRTNFVTTIGNVNVKASTGEYIESLNEKDTSATEVITLSPPTGLERYHNIILNTVQENSKTIIISVIAIIVAVSATGAIPVLIKKYKNRPIK